MKVKEFILPQVIFRLLLVSEIPGASGNSQSREMEFPHVNSLNRLHTNFHPPRKHATLVIASAEELGTMSKNNLREIYLGLGIRLI